MLKEVLDFIKNNPGARKPSIINYIGKSEVTIKRYLNELVALNLIEYRGSKKNRRLLHKILIFLKLLQGEIKCKETFEKRELTIEPKFVQRLHAKKLYNSDLGNVSTFENESDIKM